MADKAALLLDLGRLNDAVGGLMGAVRDSQRAEAILCALATVAETLLAEPDAGAAIDAAVAVLGRATTSDHVGIWEIGEGARRGDRTFARRHFWNAAGTDAARVERFEQLPADVVDGEPWLTELLAGRPVRVLARDLGARVRAAVEASGVRSGLLAPIPVAGRTWGWLSFADVSGERPWTAGEEAAARAAAAGIGAAIARRDDEAARREAEGRAAEASRLESLSVLAGGIAHDIRNCLTVISGRIAVSKLAAVHASPIEQAVEHVARLARQLQAYAGRVDVEPTAVRLDVILRDAARTLAPASGRIAFDVSGVTEVPPVLADETQVRQAVANLVGNAVQALAEDGGTVKLRCSVVDADAMAIARARTGNGTLPGRFVAVDVEDDGPGMDERTRARMFDPFFTTKPDGTGIGLAVVLGVVRGHRGAVLVDTAPGAGTRVRLLLPVDEARGASR